MDGISESITMTSLLERTYFMKNDVVEVCGRDEGFMGSYYEAEIVFPKYHNLYIVMYNNGLTEDRSGPLMTVVRPADIRPLPPTVPVPPTGFAVNDKVDAFDNGGWWVGTVTGKDGSNYRIYFEHSDSEVTYPIAQLRVHKDFVNGDWV